MERRLNCHCSVPREKKTVGLLLWEDENTVCVTEIVVRGYCLSEGRSVKVAW